ncbi:MAG TPA: SRPBCC family protein [Acidimicrobiia bacterium]|nr:SRPBCC family protein [Acidimicrobiia bacterium]
MQITTTTAVSASEAFAAIADFATLAAWDPFVRTSLLTEGRTLEPGAVYTLTTAGGMTLRYLVVEVSAPHSVVYRGGTRNVTSTERIDVAPSAEGCSVCIATELEFRGWTRLIGPLVRGGVWLGGRFISLPALRRHLIEGRGRRLGGC